MNPPRIQSDTDGGIRINPTLVWMIGAAILSGGVWIGTQVTDLSAKASALAEDQAARHAETMAYRRDMDLRVRSLESQRVGDASDIASIRREIASEINVLRRDLATLGTAIADLKEVIEAANGSYR
jgi:hypothetical protein